MLYGLLITLFVIMCFFMILIIMIQQSKGSLGLGSMGGGAQMLFGGSGGQDIFQKITWTCGALFIFGSLALTILKQKEVERPKYATGRSVSLDQELARPQQMPAGASDDATAER